MLLGTVLLDVFLSPLEDLNPPGTAGFQVLHKSTSQMTNSAKNFETLRSYRKSLLKSTGTISLLLLPPLKHRLGDCWEFRCPAGDNLLGWDFPSVKKKKLITEQTKHLFNIEERKSRDNVTLNKHKHNHPITGQSIETTAIKDSQN